MPGNEKTVAEYLITNIGNLELEHIGLVQKIENPSSYGSLQPLSSSEQLSTENSNKKADIFVNGYGVSIKQSGSSFSFNRIQRKNLWSLFEKMKFRNVEATISGLDQLIKKMHEGNFDSRDRKWREAFNYQEFFDLLEFLMMKGSPNLGVSDYQADYILTAPKNDLSSNNISFETFEQHFNNNLDNYYVSLRRQWIGQNSKSEHRRALTISKDPLNSKWCFHNVVGEPRSGWRSEKLFPIENRKTVYMIYITKKSVD